MSDFQERDRALRESIRRFGAAARAPVGEWTESARRFAEAVSNALPTVQEIVENARRMSVSLRRKPRKKP
ncbi:MAG: hypothetical protein GY856_36845 [bacterium]|nr:hypothetical protein [bacterium]